MQTWKTLEVFGGIYFCFDNDEDVYLQGNGNTYNVDRGILLFKVRACIEGDHCEKNQTKIDVLALGGFWGPFKVICAQLLPDVNAIVNRFGNKSLQLLVHGGSILGVALGLFFEVVFNIFEVWSRF